MARQGSGLCRVVAMATDMPGVVMLGCNHDQYGGVNSVSVSARVAAAISVGADPESPSMEFKGASGILNEDAVLAYEIGPVVVLAVADAHFGHESSHDLIEGIGMQLMRAAPASLKDIYDVLALIGAMTVSETESESTLLVTVFDRETGGGFGISYGDSTAALVGPDGGFRQLNQHDLQFVRAASFLTPTPGLSFSFEARPSDILLVYTDGLDECHYRNPETSVRPVHIERFVERFGADPEQLAKALATYALAGVQGNPGGQDNIAIAAASAAWPS